MKGWGVLALFPFAPVRAADNFHTSLSDRSNSGSILGFYFLSTVIFALFPTYLAWIRYRTGSFFIGLGIIIVAEIINLFLYVLFVDMTADFRLRRKLGFQGLLSAAAISGTFSLLAAVVLEAGVLGLGRVRSAVPIALGVVVLWQGIVEVVNIRRLYATAIAIPIEIVARTLSIAMALGFLGFASGQARPWQHWNDILKIFR